MNQTTQGIGVLLDGQNYNLSRATNSSILVFTSIPPAPMTNNSNNTICTSKDNTVTCTDKFGDKLAIPDCQFSAINGGNQVTCNLNSNLTTKNQIFAQVPTTPNYINTNWLWIIIILIIVYLLFVLYKKH